MKAALATVTVCLAVSQSLAFNPLSGIRSVIRPRVSLKPNHVSSIPVENAEVKPPSKSADKKDRLTVAIGDKWYDLTGWRKAHPGGGHWIDMYKDLDATDIMSAFHSDEALQMFQKFPTVDREPFKPSPESVAFRKFRAKLVEDGWFNRNPLKEAQILVSWLASYGIGVFLAQTHPILATLWLSMVTATAGWLAHDYVHGRGKWCNFMRPFGNLSGGLSPKWWSNKHNKHHAETNVMGVDEDMMVDPALWLWAPDPKNDAPWRKYQHLYYYLPYMLTLLIWRFDSIKTIIKEKLWGEAFFTAVHYAVNFALLPLPVFIGNVLGGGALIAAIVTCTHQSEDLLESLEDDGFCMTQFRTTRDAITSDPISEYVWGGMQYQLEHHLFPTMPRYKYRELVPLVKQFAAENGIDYKTTDQWKILVDNYENYKRVAAQPAVAGAPDSRYPF